MKRRLVLLAGAAGLIVAVAQAQQQSQAPARFGFGRPATPAEIGAWDVDVGPDGKGLPPGRGTAAEGAVTYAAKCAACHGKTGKEGPNDVLVGREPRGVFPAGKEVEARRTIGNYWPYATTVFDYIRRAMPTPAPGSLTDDEVYGLVAFLLAANEIVPADAVMDATTLPKVVMPARDKFVIDSRGGPKAGTVSPKGR
jgi:mono/diheme cytochrome c family protein